MMHQQISIKPVRTAQEQPARHHHHHHHHHQHRSSFVPTTSRLIMMYAIAVLLPLLQLEGGPISRQPGGVGVVAAFRSLRPFRTRIPRDQTAALTKAGSANQRRSSGNDGNNETDPGAGPNAFVATTALSQAKASFWQNGSSSIWTKMKKKKNNNGRVIMQQQQQRRKFARTLLAEALGTGLIVFLGLGAVMAAVVTPHLTGGLFPIAAVWTMAVTVAIATTGGVSGAHLNPAVTLALCGLRGSPVPHVVPFYIMAQFVGGVGASALAYLLYASQIAAWEAIHGIVRSSSASSAIATAKCFGEYFAAPVTAVQAFLAEAVGTAILGFVIFALTHERNNIDKTNNIFIPPLIGSTVGALICVLAPLTQAGVRKEESCFFVLFFNKMCGQTRQIDVERSSGTWTLLM